MATYLPVPATAAIAIAALASPALAQGCPPFSAGPARLAITAGHESSLTLSVDFGARLVTSDGNIDINLMLDEAPVTCANFLNYVRSGRYNGTIFHRSQRPVVPNYLYGLIQGGGFTVPQQPLTTPSASPSQTPQPLVTDPPVPIEHPIGNVRGTIGLARTNSPLSGTSQFYFNTTDNNADIPGERTSFDAVPGDSNRLGFSVFGTVTPASLATIDAINNHTYYDMSSFFGTQFSAVPLRLPPNQIGLPLLPSTYSIIYSASTRSTPAGEWAGSGGWSYRWRRNGVDMNDGGRISGTATPQLGIAAMNIADAGIYECRVTGVSCAGGTTTSTTVTLFCPSDLGSVGGLGTPDGRLDNNDFVVFISYFFGRDPRADVGSTGGERGTDGAFDNNDFVAFIDHFFDGC